MPKKQLAYFVPNLFTALNMACGFVGMLLSVRGEYYKASIIIILGIAFDLVDGRVARLTGTQSSFGEQFDSMSDVVTFGVAPAFLFYHRFLVDFGRLGLVFSFIYLLCAALRLARFNASLDKISSDYFQGIPSPGAAMALSGYVLFSTQLGLSQELRYIALGYVLFYAILMISNLPFPSFKKSEWARKNRKLMLIILFAILTSVFIYEEFMVLAVSAAYVLSSITYFLFNRKKFKGIFSWAYDEEHEED